MKSKRTKFKLTAFLIVLNILLINLQVNAASIAIKFTVDMSYQISQGIFSIASDKVYLRGSFNNYDLSNQMTSSGSGVYTITLNLESNTLYGFKFFTDATGFPNGGYESQVGFFADYRSMTLGEHNLELAKLYFNNANMILRKSSTYFNLYCADSDLNMVDPFNNYLESNFERVTSSLETTIGSKVNVRIYPDKKSYYISMGFPESPDWAVGSAIGRTEVLLVSPNVLGYIQGQLDVAVHEFTHITVAWKNPNRIPGWLNEGAATYFGKQIPDKNYVKSLINNLGYKPPFSYLENNNFAEVGGYQFSYTIAEFIIAKHGMNGFANYVGNNIPSTLGYTDQTALQSAWHKFLDTEYLGLTGIGSAGLPVNYSLSQNYPNPFNPSTTIKYTVPKRGFVSLKVYDALGKEIKSLVNEEKNAGTYEINFNASGIASGVYFYRFTSAAFSDCKKLILLK